MSVRIYTDGLAGASLPGAGRTDELSRAPGTGRTGAGPVGAGEDRVEISALSENIASTGTLVDAQRADRVSHLAALYQSGRYEVDPSKVSHAMVSSALRGGPLENGE